MRGLSNFLMAMQQKFSLHEHDHLLAVTTFAFDISALEILFTSLLVVQVYQLRKREDIQEPSALTTLFTGKKE